MIITFTYLVCWYLFNFNFEERFLEERQYQYSLLRNDKFGHLIDKICITKEIINKEEALFSIINFARNRTRLNNEFIRTVETYRRMKAIHIIDSLNKTCTYYLKRKLEMTQMYGNNSRAQPVIDNQETKVNKFVKILINLIRMIQKESKLDFLNRLKNQLNWHTKMDKFNGVIYRIRHMIIVLAFSRIMRYSVYRSKIKHLKEHMIKSIFDKYEKKIMAFAYNALVNCDKFVDFETLGGKEIDHHDLRFQGDNKPQNLDNNFKERPEFQHQKSQVSVSLFNGNTSVYDRKGSSSITRNSIKPSRNRSGFQLDISPSIKNTTTPMKFNKYFFPNPSLQKGNKPSIQTERTAQKSHQNFGKEHNTNLTYSGYYDRADLFRQDRSKTTMNYDFADDGLQYDQENRWNYYSRKDMLKRNESAIIGGFERLDTSGYGSNTARRQNHKHPYFQNGSQNCVADSLHHQNFHKSANKRITFSSISPNLKQREFIEQRRFNNNLSKNNGSPNGVQFKRTVSSNIIPYDSKPKQHQLPQRIETNPGDNLSLSITNLSGNKIPQTQPSKQYQQNTQEKRQFTHLSSNVIMDRLSPENFLAENQGSSITPNREIYGGGGLASSGPIKKIQTLAVDQHQLQLSGSKMTQSIYNRLGHSKTEFPSRSPSIENLKNQRLAMSQVQYDFNTPKITMTHPVDETEQQSSQLSQSSKEQNIFGTNQLPKKSNLKQTSNKSFNKIKNKMNHHQLDQFYKKNTSSHEQSSDSDIYHIVKGFSTDKSSNINSTINTPGRIRAEMLYGKDLEEKTIISLANILDAENLNNDRDSLVTSKQSEPKLDRDNPSFNNLYNNNNNDMNNFSKLQKYQEFLNENTLMAKSSQNDFYLRRSNTQNIQYQGPK